MTQRLEAHFGDALKKEELLHHRIMHVAMRYCTQPGDFFVFTDKVYLVECKECAGNTFVFSRLTQGNLLLEYNNINIIDSYVLISFWRGRKTKSYYFLIPINILMNFIKNHHKKSANLEDMMYFKDFLTEYKDICAVFKNNVKN